MTNPPPAVPKVLKAVLLLLDVSPKKLKDWPSIKSNIKTASSFIKQVLEYNPTKLQKKLKFKHINRILKGIDSI
jgi:hypothetical protein